MPELTAGCGVCGTPVSPRSVRCAAHKHWRLTACSACDRPFHGANRARNGRKVFCPDCRRPPKPDKPTHTDLEWKQCGTCQTWIGKPGKGYCNEMCRRKRPRTCSRCAGSIPHTTWTKVCKSCLTPAEAQARRDRMRRREQRRGTNHRKRARILGVELEAVNPNKVYVRDGWRCGICHKSVDKRLKWPHPMSASLDHIEPMALGGGHTYRNTQCAHWICNTLKSDRGAGDQLALIG